MEALFFIIPVVLIFTWVIIYLDSPSSSSTKSKPFDFLDEIEIINDYPTREIPNPDKKIAQILNRQGSYTYNDPGGTEYWYTDGTMDYLPYRGWKTITTHRGDKIKTNI